MSGDYKYPSPLLTVKTRPLPEHMEPDELSRTSITKYTKHYYIGTERIASALGTMNNLGLLCENVWPGSQDIIDEMGDKTAVATEILIADYNIFEKELQLPEPYRYETYICTKLEHEPDNYDAYWYHPDHLGSSSYITNLAGDVSQHMEYLPFGELLVEEHLNSYNSPYKFNAKEFDAETGNYYYGARYYSPKYNLMLSPDPASHLYPGWSPYAYTLHNPVRYTDPTGMVVENAQSPDDWYENTKTGELVWKNNQAETITDDTGTWKNVGEELLTFDGEKLTYYTQEELDDGNLKLHSKSFDAVSGTQLEDGTFDYSKEAQAAPFLGPLPEGDYTVNPNEIQWWTDQSFITRTAAFLKKGTWPGGIFAWGAARVWLNPEKVSVKNPATGKNVIRDNFSIHGGAFPGSAGCIDCTYNAVPFFRMLEKSKENSIRLRVDY